MQTQLHNEPTCKFILMNTIKLNTQLEIRQISLFAKKLAKLLFLDKSKDTILFNAAVSLPIFSSTICCIKCIIHGHVFFQRCCNWMQKTVLMLFVSKSLHFHKQHKHDVERMFFKAENCTKYIQGKWNFFTDCINGSTRNILKKALIHK